MKTTNKPKKKTRQLRHCPVELKMTPAARELLREVRQHIDEFSKDEITTRYDIGTKVIQASTDKNKYGEHVIGQLALVLDERPIWLYRCGMIASIWEREQIDKLVSRRTVFGRRITVTHLLLLAGSREHQRDKLTEAVFEEGLTTRQLAERAGHTRGGKLNRGMIPRSVEAGLSFMEKLLKPCVELEFKWEASVFQKVREKDDKALDAKHLKSVRKVREVVRDLHKILTNGEAQLAAYEKTLEEIEAKNKEAERRLASSGPSHARLMKRKLSRDVGTATADQSALAV